MRGSNFAMPSCGNNVTPDEQDQGGHQFSAPHELVGAESAPVVSLKQHPFDHDGTPSIGALVRMPDPNASPSVIHQRAAEIADEQGTHLELRPTRLRAVSARQTSSRAVSSKPLGEKDITRTAAAPLPELAQLPERPASKTCRRCLLVKPAAAFQIDRHNADGMQSYCRECKALRARERRTERIMAPDDEEMLDMAPAGRSFGISLHSTAVEAFSTLLQCVTATLPIAAIASSQLPAAADAGFASTSSGTSTGDSAFMQALETNGSPLLDSSTIATAAPSAGALPPRRRRKGRNPQSSAFPGLGPADSIGKETQSLGAAISGKGAADVGIKGTKCCRKCRQVLSLSKFHKNRTTNDGHQLYCKFCHTQALQPSKKVAQAEGQGAPSEGAVVQEPPVQLVHQRLSGLRPQRPRPVMRFDYDDDDDYTVSPAGVVSSPEASASKKMHTRTGKRKEREGAFKGDSTGSCQPPLPASVHGCPAKGAGGASRDATASAKKCRRCQVTKPAAQFWRNRSTVDGLQWFCKSCQSMACAAPASRPSLDAEKCGRQHAVQTGHAASTGRAANRSQPQAMAQMSRRSKSARQDAPVMVSGSNGHEDVELRCGLRALADAATTVDLQRSTLLTAFELTIGLSQQQQQQQQQQQRPATTQLPMSSTVPHAPDCTKVASVVPVAATGKNIIQQRAGADRATGHSTTIQSSGIAATSQPVWQLPAWQLGGSVNGCTVTSAHFREDLSPQHFSTAVGASMGAATATNRTPELEDSKRSFNGWLPGNTQFVGSSTGQPQVYRWLPSLTGRPNQQQHQNPLGAAMAAIKRQRVLSAEMTARHGAIDAVRPPSLFVDPSTGKSPW